VASEMSRNAKRSRITLQAPGWPKTDNQTSSLFAQFPSRTVTALVDTI